MTTALITSAYRSPCNTSVIIVCAVLQHLEGGSWLTVYTRKKVPFFCEIKYIIDSIDRVYGHYFFLDIEQKNKYILLILQCVFCAYLHEN